jgi:uncharacterized membrane protein YfcA
LPDILIWPGFVLLGIGVGAYGTMVGAGGGFLLVPLLLVFYPDEAPEALTSLSLVVVLINSISGSAAYVSQRRIDYVAANAFALATVPGGILGALATGLIPRDTFDALFAVLLIVAALLIVLRPAPPLVGRTGRAGELVRQITDAAGDTYVYSYNLRTGIVATLFIGFIASLLGIGGGLLQVPMLMFALHFPAHLATATSQYIVVVTALVGSLTHLAAGSYTTDHVGRTMALALGVIVGGQLGARLSMRMRSATLVRLLSVALVGLSVRLLIAVLL